MTADFEEQSYWHERYQSERLFEWLQPSDFFWNLVEPLLLKFPRQENPPKVLQLGSGTSDLHNYFRRHGYLDVTNVDFEPLAIERGRQIEELGFGDIKMKYVVADVTQLRDNLPEDEIFDVVVDKSTVDAVACGGDDQLLKMAYGVRKCIAERGIWISLSYSADRFSIKKLPFNVEVVHKIPNAKAHELDPDVYHYCYLLRPIGSMEDEE
ncbi:S-adenosyl-L-methionine-dependent methyltransferase [Hypoxylon sp. FL0543]|nr:S-adenosyl-L-methionine-dependent methyltransferase [Hypoxylon sp. FL0543]